MHADGCRLSKNLLFQVVLTVLLIILQQTSHLDLLRLIQHGFDLLVCGIVVASERHGARYLAEHMW